jgi:hypothetical protein
LTQSRIRLSSGFAFLQSLTQPILAQPGARTPSPAPLMGFRSLQHLLASRVHVPRVCLARFVPPSGFGYPLDGLRPSRPRRPCFMPTALMGFITPFGAFPSRKVPEGITLPGEPACRYPIVTPSGEPSGRTDRPRLPGFDPSGSPSPSPSRLALGRAGCSPGIWSFLGLSTGRLDRVSPALLSHAWRCGGSADDRKRLRLRVSIGAWLARSPSPGRTKRGGPSSPSKVFAPCRSRAFELPTVRAMGSPRESPAITGRRSHS